MPLIPPQLVCHRTRTRASWAAGATSLPKETSYMQASSSHVGQGRTDSLEPPSATVGTTPGHSSEAYPTAAHGPLTRWASSSTRRPNGWGMRCAHGRQESDLSRKLLSNRPFILATV